ncbi:MAG: hypothetical protein RSD78_04850 [Oscillospiraceae bacterium]
MLLQCTDDALMTIQVFCVPIRRVLAFAPIVISVCAFRLHVIYRHYKQLSSIATGKDKAA